MLSARLRGCPETGTGALHLVPGPVRLYNIREPVPVSGQPLRWPTALVAAGLAVALAATASCASETGQDALKKPPLVAVQVIHRLAPERLDSQVAAVLEKALQPLEGATDVFAESGEGRVRALVFFRPGNDPYRAAQSVQEAIQRCRGKLPKEAAAPELYREDPEAEPLLWLALSSKVRAAAELGELARLVSRRLLAVPGTAEVRLVGAPQRRLVVQEVRTTPGQSSSLDDALHKAS